jgi:DNA-directed RNA polymerase subunit RPC12/RpoP
MEVLKHGNTYKEVECKGCGALLSYCKLDIEKQEYFDGLFKEVYVYKEYIMCPECKNRIILKYKINGDDQLV